MHSRRSCSSTHAVRFAIFHEPLLRFLGNFFPLTMSPPPRELKLRKGDGQDEHQIMTAPACRWPSYSSSTPTGTDTEFIDTAFVDPRFVHPPTPAIVPPLDFTRLGTETYTPSVRGLSRLPAAATAGTYGEYPLPDVISGAMCPMHMPGATPQRHKLRAVAGSTATTTACDKGAVDSQNHPDHSRPAPTISTQDPGLRDPRPPSVPAPRAKREKEGVPLLGRQSLSARLARFAAAGTTGRVLPLELV